MERVSSNLTAARRWRHAAQLGRTLAVGAMAAALAALPAAALAAQGQPGVVAGTVVSERSLAGLSDAQVAIEGTQLGATTDAQGRFRIANVPGTAARLTVRRIGFRPYSDTVQVGRTDLRIRLAERAIELNQVVVTGTVGAEQQRSVGNAVARVRASDVVATQPVQNVQDLLTGRATGVSVIGSSGQVGTGSRIRVRGASSLSLANDPLIYVDGIRVDNTQASGPVNQAFGSRSISRWNDFDPDDIESIEVIKGPAAATLYGTEASNGVVQIITKRGGAGRPVWSFTGRYGANFIPDWKHALYDNYGVVPVAGSATARDTVVLTVSQLNDSLQANFGNDIFRRGTLQDLQLSVSGGTNALRYYLGGNYEENEGVERDNHLRRTNLRANFSAAPTEKWDVQSSMGYTTGRTYLPLESGGGGATWATYFSSPAFLGVNGSPQLGFRSGPPDIYYETLDSFQDADRFTGSVTVEHRPAAWFNHRLVLGVDRLAENNEERAPRNDILGNRYAAFSYLTGEDAGYIDASTRDVTSTTFDYAASVPWTINEAWTSTTSVGGQYYGRRTRRRAFFADSFAVSGLATLSVAGRRRIDDDDLIENNTVGGYVQEQVAWNNRLFVTAALRTDDNSAFGTNFDAVTYPKVSASWVASEEPAIPLPDLITTLRLRAAYGASGLQPGAFDAIRTYSLTGTGGTVTPFSPGNPDLGPEKSTELEVGLDLGLFDDRYGAELTYYNGSTKDAILSRLAPPSAGFPDLQFFNAGQVDRNGFEWLLRAQPLSAPNAVLDLSLSGSTNKYEIRSLGAGTERISLTSNVQHVVGYAPGAWWDRRVVSADKTVNPSGTVTLSNVLCDDGQGGTVACATAPRVFLGNSVPTYEGSFTAGLTLLRDFRINAFFDWRGGYKKLDGNRRVRCNLFSLCRENFYPSEFDAVTLAEVQGGTAFTYNLIRDASFTRFRELSVTYSLPERFASRAGASRASITVAGRNLGLWTDYPGLEPEASFNGGTRGGAFGQWEQNVLPQLRQIVTTFNVSF